MENNKEKEAIKLALNKLELAQAVLKYKIPEDQKYLEGFINDAVDDLRNVPEENESPRDKLANVLLEENEIIESHKEDTSKRLKYAIATLKRIGNDVNIKLPQIRIMADKIAKELDLPNFKK